jgi:hypothetical protein
MRQLKQELRGFEDALKAAGHRESSIQTYVGRTEFFLRWLDGDYEPRGSNAVSRSHRSRPRRRTSTAGLMERSDATPGRIEIATPAQITPFDWKWPSGSIERFERGWEFEARSGGLSHVIRHALTEREAFGRRRVRSVTWVDDQVAVEGVETDAYGADRTLASMLRIKGRQHVKSTAEVPAGYTGFDVLPLDAVVTGKGVFSGYAVEIPEDDLASWARHAMLRMRSKGR